MQTPSTDLHLETILRRALSAISAFEEQLSVSSADDPGVLFDLGLETMAATSSVQRALTLFAQVRGIATEQH